MTQMHLLSTSEFSLPTNHRPTQSAREILGRRGLPEGRFVRLWGGFGTLRACEGCGHSIETDEVEYELEFCHAGLSVLIRLHRDCWESWSEEDSP